MSLFLVLSDIAQYNSTRMYVYYKLFSTINVVTLAWEPFSCLILQHHIVILSGGGGTEVDNSRIRRTAWRTAEGLPGGLDQRLSRCEQSPARRRWSCNPRQPGYLRTTPRSDWSKAWIATSTGQSWWRNTDRSARTTRTSRNFRVRRSTIAARARSEDDPAIVKVRYVAPHLRFILRPRQSHFYLWHLSSRHCSTILLRRRKLTCFDLDCPTLTLALRDMHV